MGIEPTASAWKAEVLPLYDTCSGALTSTNNGWTRAVGRLRATQKPQRNNLLSSTVERKGVKTPDPGLSREPESAWNVIEGSSRV
jgi:hypothetical protein